LNAALVHRLWRAASRRAARRFHYAARHLAETQAQMLDRYLTRNRATAYLREHAASLPLTTYDDYLPYIERIANGEQNILTAEPVRVFEPSSGSTAASKLIPYTRTLQQEFQRGLATWITDLFTHYPAILSRPAYWSISPLTDGPRRTPGGLPIGIEDDSAYLGPLGALMASAFPVPGLVKHIRDVTAFRYVTLLHLLRCENLGLISVWNPTFLTLLLEPLPQWWDALLRDTAHGTLTSPAPLDENIQRTLLKALPPRPQRARQLARLQPTDYTSIWRKLALISCWADGASKPYAAALQEKFPNVMLQPKGLLATEAFITFPLTAQAGGVLAITSHFFEFIADSGDILRAHQIEKGKTYSVVVTTGGGFYRYQLNDIVEVTGIYHQAPCLRFIGKADFIADYFGEKLNEQFVAHTLAQLFARHRLSPVFSMLAPEDEPSFCYILFLELPDQQTVQNPSALSADLDAALRENFHYDYCRKLGQLAAARVAFVPNGAQTYLLTRQSHGLKLGDIKPGVLQKTTGWSRRFAAAHPLWNEN